MNPGSRLDVPPVWAAEITAWGEWLRAAGQTQGTVEQRTYHIRRFAAVRRGGPWTVSPDELVNWLAGHDWSTNTLRMSRNSLCAFYRWSVQTERIPKSPASGLPPVRVKLGVPRPAPEHVIVQALQQADHRARLMILLAASVGLRRGELAMVRTDDAQRYPDGWRLRVIGKGGKIRVLPLPDDLGEALAALPPGWAFPGSNGEPMTPAHVGRVVSRVLGPGWTTHTLRHRFASTAYAAERDIMAVRDLLGHSNVRTTQIYTAVPDGSLRAAVRAAALPV